ncbi:hypothetical protein AB0N16_12890 [Streptomyces sp. NPDC051105]
MALSSVSLHTRALLAGHGFGDVRAEVLAAPPGRRIVGTLIVSARA